MTTGARSLLVVQTALAIALAGCVELKGASAEPDTGAMPRDGAPDGGSVAPPYDASTGGPADGAADADDGYASLAAALAAKRVRLADVPSEWFVSRSRVYAVDAQKKAHSWKPPSGPTVDYAFTLVSYSHLSGNDDYVVDVADDITVYAAGEPNHLLGVVDDSAAWDEVKAASKAIVIVHANGTGRDLHLWDPAVAPAPSSVLSFAEPGGLRFMRSHGDTLYYAAPAGTTLWTIDTAKKSATASVLPHTANALDVANGRIVIESATGGSVSHALVEDGKPPRDLTAEISATTSIVPKSARMAVGSFSQYGDWLVYAAWGGILAFDVVGGRLVPCQIRDGADGLYLSPRVLEADKLLVFTRNAGPTQSGASQGLYYVPLASVLPP